MSYLDFQFLQAAIYGKLIEVKRLVKEGADVNYKDENGYTPLHWTTCHGDTEVMRFLIENGANVNAKNNNGWTPLHYAICYGQLNSAIVLLDNEADLLVINYEGKTPLDCANNKDGFLTKLMAHRSHQKLKTGITEVQDKMGSTAAAPSGMYNTGTCGINDGLKKLMERNVQLASEWTVSKDTMKSGITTQANTAALQNQTMSEISALMEQYKIAGAHAVGDKLQTEHSIAAAERAKAEQAEDDRIFNLLKKRKELKDALHLACEIDEWLPLPKKRYIN
jgi:hypothetical protein